MIDNVVIKYRNKFWKKNKNIPSWVDIETVGLDQFFTTDDVALYCFNSLKENLKKINLNTENYDFIEPSAGKGAFYNLLPNNKIGVDVELFNSDYIQADFLSWYPKKENKYICIGNPPFGYRAWLALQFINHASNFSDVVAFILPMSFQSRGKSNVQDRVKNLKLIHSEILPSNIFINKEGKSEKVNALWQIWVNPSLSPSTLNKIENKTCSDYVDLFTVDKRPERLCGMKKIDQAHFFIQRTFYNKPPSLVKSFDEIKYVCGYGIIIKKEKKKIISILKNTNWIEYSNLASHNCRHISLKHIKTALIENGVFDE